ncbi:MAG: NUDIX domain-containing protein [Bryobacteraceae bacterium]
MNNPYRLLDSRPICESGVFQLREDLVEGPRAKRFTFSVAEVKSGSSILPVTGDGYVYLIREYKYAIGRPSVEVASGAIEQGESPLAAAQRELHEELGLAARQWVELGTIDPFTTQLVSPNYQFLALDLEQVRKDPDEAEVIQRVKLRLDEAVRMVMANEITHAPSCTLLLKAQIWLMTRAKPTGDIS